MEPLFIAALISVGSYLVIIALIPRHVLLGSSAYTHSVLSRLRQSNLVQQGGQAGQAPADGGAPSDNNPLVRAFLVIPFMDRAVPLLQRAGMMERLDRFVLACLLVFLFLVFSLSRLGAVALLLAVLITWLGAALYLHRRVHKRHQLFIEQFPDALDTIVRGVRVGHPLNAAIRVIGENMPAPIGPEFKRVSDEMSYGASLLEALNRLADRVNDQDVRFFAVVLAVQQESGGNIAETLSNLSSVVRKRREFKLKLKALASQGNMTAWIIGAIPLFLIAILSYMSPHHLVPLYTTNAGHILVAVALGMMITGVIIMRQIVSMEF